MEEQAAPVESSVPVESSALESAPSFSVPEAYSGEKWAQNITSLDGLFKEHANLQGMIGNRPPAIPGRDADGEAWDSYLSNIRPESADSYAFDLPEVLRAESVPEETRKEILEGLAPYKQMMHDAGLSEYQATKLMNAVLQAEVEGKNLGQVVTGPIENKTNLEQAQNDEAFRDSLKGKYGDDAAKAVSVAKDFVANQSDEVKQAFESMSNDQALALVNILYDQHKSYNTQDRAVVDSSPYSGMSQDEIADKLGQLNVQQQNLKNNFGSAEYKKIVAERNALRDRLRRM